MAEIGVIVRSDQEQEVQYAVQYILILPLNFILLKDDMLASLSDTGYCSFPEGSKQRLCRKWLESRGHFDGVNVSSGTEIQC